MAEVAAWERQPGETDGAWHAWTVMRDLPFKDRSHVKCAEVSGFRPGSVRTWADTWKWFHRLRAWDAELDRAYTVETLEERRRVGRANAQVGSLAIARLAEKLKAVEGRKLTPTQAARFGEVGLKLQQMRLGSADAPRDTVEEEGRKALGVDDPDGLMKAFRDPETLELARELADRLADRASLAAGHGAESRPGDEEAGVAAD